MPSRAKLILSSGKAVSGLLGLSVSNAVSQKVASKVAAKFMASKLVALQENLSYVLPDASKQELVDLSHEAVASYARYWSELFNVGSQSKDKLAAGFTVDGFEHIENVIKEDQAPILCLPHLGGWEWAAAWLNRCKDLDVTAVVESLEPRDVFDWFKSVREGYGIEVVELGDKAFGQLAKSVAAQKVICLLVDRDISETGVEVDFFGSKTTMPAGPALLSLRTGAPLIPTAVYFDGAHNRHAKVCEPIWPKRQGKLSQDVADMTQKVGIQLEGLIRKDPTGWHVLSPIFVE